MSKKRIQVGITLTEETLKRLDEIVNEMGLTKSHALSMLINKYWMDSQIVKLEELKGK